MMEDFYLTSGSTIRPSDEELDRIRAEYDRSWTVALESPLAEVASQALQSLQAVDGLLKEGGLDAARALLASPAVVTTGLRITPRPRVAVQGAWKTCAKDATCRSALDDAQRSLQELEDWCFANRLEFYNTADQKQVMQKGDKLQKALARIQASIDEPLEMSSQAQDAFRQILVAGKNL